MTVVEPILLSSSVSSTAAWQQMKTTVETVYCGILTGFLPSSLTMRSLLVSYFSICWFLLSLILFSDWKRCTTFAQNQTRSKWLRSTNKKTHTVRRYSVSVVCVVNFNTFVTHMNSAFIFFLVPLDKPEEFLLQIHKMDHFAERLECWLYNYKFTETITAIGKTCLFVKPLLSLGAMGDTLNRLRCVYDFLQCNTYSCLTQRFYPTYHLLYLYCRAGWSIKGLIRLFSFICRQKIIGNMWGRQFAENRVS